MSYSRTNLHGVELTASTPGQPSTTTAERNCCYRHILVNSDTEYGLHFHHCANPGRSKHLTVCHPMRLESVCESGCLEKHNTLSCLFPMLLAFLDEE